MSRRIQILLSLFVLAGTLKLSAQGTAFNYQGQLSAGGSLANGSYNLRFAVFDAVTNGNRASVWLTNYAVAVSNGLFTTTLDYGVGIFTGTNYWLDIAVQGSGDTNFTELVPRQPILPVPYAIFAATASNVLGTVSATQLTGTLPSTQISGNYSNPVSFTNGANNFSGTFTGNGSALSGLNASQLASGTVADARLSGNVALLNGSQTFTGANNFTNLAGNSFSGSFFGNGLVGWIVVSNSAVQAAIDHGYLLASPQFTTVTLPAAPDIGDIVRISGAGSGGWRVVTNAGQSFTGNFSSYQNSLWLPATVSGTGWLSLDASADGTLMYAAGATGVFTSTDAGQIWNGPNASFSGSWSGIATSADGQTVLAVTPTKAIKVSYDAGGSWGTVASVLASNCIAIACSAAGTKAIASVKSGLVYTNSPVGVWASIGVAAGSWNVVAFAGGGNNYAAANTGGTVNTLAGGSVSVTNKPVTGLAISADGTKLAACVNPGHIYTSTNSGISWLAMTNAPSTNWNCLAASSDCTRLVAGVTNGQIYASVNFGQTWSPLVGSTNLAWSALAASSDGTKLAGAVNSSSGQIYYSGAAAQSATVTNGTLSGSQGSAVELQYIGNGQFMPVSSTGTLWAN